MNESEGRLGLDSQLSYRLCANPRIGSCLSCSLLPRNRYGTGAKNPTDQDANDDRSKPFSNRVDKNINPVSHCSLESWYVPTYTPYNNNNNNKVFLHQYHLLLLSVSCLFLSCLVSSFFSCVSPSPHSSHNSPSSLLSFVCVFLSCPVLSFFWKSILLPRLSVHRMLCD